MSKTTQNKTEMSFGDWSPWALQSLCISSISRARWPFPQGGAPRLIGGTPKTQLTAAAQRRRGSDAVLKKPKARQTPPPTPHSCAMHLAEWGLRPGPARDGFAWEGQSRRRVGLRKLAAPCSGKGARLLGDAAWTGWYHRRGEAEITSEASFSGVRR